jgi:IclR family transcriptional regulator, acetate operon repressor
VSDTEAPRGTLGTVRNAAALLDLLSSGPAFQQLSDLADRSGLSMPTVHRLLRSLVAAGLAEQDPASARYSLGPELVRLSAHYLERLPILQALRPYLVDLRNRTDATVLVATLIRGTVVYVERMDGAQAAGALRRTGRSFPAHETVAGRLLLARLGPDAWKDLADPPTHIESWARDGVLTGAIDGMRDQLEVAVAIDRGEHAAPLALVATGGPPAFTHERLVDEVVPELQQTAELMRRLAVGG